VSDGLVRRITNLLRLARDQEGTNEGKNALRMAKLLMAKHGILVELEDRDTSDEKAAMIVVEPEPVPWPEYLGTTLATVYRCEYTPRWTGVAWQFWIYSNEPERVSTCRDHFDFVARQVATRTDVLAERLLYMRSRDPTRYENKLNSYAEGLVYQLATKLLRNVGWDGLPPFMADGFDKEAYRAKTKDPLDPEPETEDTGEPGLKRYRYVAPADPPFDEEPNAAPPPNRVLDTDPEMFARGRRESGYLTLIPARLADAFR